MNKQQQQPKTTKNSMEKIRNKQKYFLKKFEKIRRETSEQKKNQNKEKQKQPKNSFKKIKTNKKTRTTTIVPGKGVSDVENCTKHSMITGANIIPFENTDIRHFNFRLKYLIIFTSRLLTISKILSIYLFTYDKYII